jgi:hypothetical protein
MKNFIIITCLLFSSTVLMAQKCYTKKDEFTGKLTKVISTPLVGSLLSMGPTVSFAKVDSIYSICYSFSADLSPDAFTPASMYLALKFANGDIERFTATKQSRVTRAMGTTVIAFYGDISIKQLQKLANNSLSIVRISYNGDDNTVFDQTVKEGKAQKISESVKCVLE